MAGFIGPGGYRVKITERVISPTNARTVFYFTIYPPADPVSGSWSHEVVAQSTNGYVSYDNATRAGKTACERLKVRDQQQWAEARGLGTS